jgi:hypothetical protein
MRWIDINSRNAPGLSFLSFPLLPVYLPLIFVSTHRGKGLQENAAGFKEIKMTKWQTFDELMDECGATAQWEAKAVERDVKKQRKYGMEPGETARDLKRCR